MTSSLIGGDLSSGAGSEVIEDWRREMLAYDWFMSDSLTQPGGHSRGEEHGVKVSLTCPIGLVPLIMVTWVDYIKICLTVYTSLNYALL